MSLVAPSSQHQGCCNMNQVTPCTTTTTNTNTTHNNSNRKFSLVVNTDVDNNSNTANNTMTSAKPYNIPHPKKKSFDINQLDDSTTNSKGTTGRRPMTGSLMRLKPINSTGETASIKIRSMSCPLVITERTYDEEDQQQQQKRRLSLKESYNQKYVENLKRDLMDFFAQKKEDSHASLEEEVIEEEAEEEVKAEENDSPLYSTITTQLHEENEQNQDQYDEEDEEEEENFDSTRMLSSCISDRSALTPALEEEEFDLEPASSNDSTATTGSSSHFNHHKTSSVSSSMSTCTAATSPMSTKSSCLSIYSFNTDAKICHRHHHRRPSCAIKFEEPKILEWEKLGGGGSENNENEDDDGDHEYDSFTTGDDSNDLIFKKNYTLNQSVL